MVIINNNGRQYEPHIQYLMCGDDFMSGAKGFTIPKEYSKKLTKKNLERFIKFIQFNNRITITDSIKEVTILAQYAKEFRLIFKLFRYFRSAEHLKVLEKIMEINEKGFPFTTSLLLGHFVEPVKKGKSQWSSGMDIIDLRYVRIDSGLEYFNEHFRNTGSINGFWQLKNKVVSSSSEHVKTTSKLRKLIAEEKYKEAQEFIKN